MTQAPAYTWPGDTIHLATQRLGCALGTQRSIPGTLGLD